VKRWVAATIAVILGAVVAAPVVVGITAGLAGAMWIFVFGDDTWPAWVDPAFMIAITLLALAIWAGMAWVIWLQLTVRRRAG
jgi:hypothetical protein